MILLCVFSAVRCARALTVLLRFSNDSVILNLAASGGDICQVPGMFKEKCTCVKTRGPSIMQLAKMSIDREIDRTYR